MTERDILYPSEIPSQRWRESKRNLFEKLNQRKRETGIEVVFRKGTRIRPRNRKNQRFFGWRTVEEDLPAESVINEENEKQEKREGLPLWQALEEIPIWNGKTRRRFSLTPGEYFLAYQRNAEELEEKE